LLWPLYAAALAMLGTPAPRGRFAIAAMLILAACPALYEWSRLSGPSYHDTLALDAAAAARDAGSAGTRIYWAGAPEYAAASAGALEYLLGRPVLRLSGDEAPRLGDVVVRALPADSPGGALSIGRWTG